MTWKIFLYGWAPPTCSSLIKPRMDTLVLDYPIITYIVVCMSNKKYNPEDYKDVDFCTVGNGPVRIQFARPANLTVGDFFYFSKKLFEIESELGLVKTLAEEADDAKAVAEAN